MDNRRAPEDRKIFALAGNPNVGKSTVFNALTGMRQHTGNWPGKTVSNARGICETALHSYELVDLPGTYSLMAHSQEEEIARDFLCFGSPDGVVVVCDATCLERNLNLVLQVLEITSNVIVCVNLMDEAKRKGICIDLGALSREDEAKRKGICIDLGALSRELGVPVVGTAARRKKSLSALLAALDGMPEGNDPAQVVYAREIEDAIAIVEPALDPICEHQISSRWLSLKLLDPDPGLLKGIRDFLGVDPLDNEPVQTALERAHKHLADGGFTCPEHLKDAVVSALVHRSEEIGQKTVHRQKPAYSGLDRRLDALLTSRRTGYPVMLALLAGIFWITIVGANDLSELLSAGLFWVQDRLTDWFLAVGAPRWLYGALVHGVYRVMAWVVSVMLPPMAIFFPLFTLLEDAGYLPRVAYDLDKPFQCCNACGKQALCMCMGFGCNAAGVVGCRIIDSPRERLLAILTNSFVPCNGRFPTLIALGAMFFGGAAGAMGGSFRIIDSPRERLLAILTNSFVPCNGRFPTLIALGAMFFGGAAGAMGGSFRTALVVTGAVLLAVGMTFLMTKFLSVTLLRGTGSSFTLEMPPYRPPQLGKVLVRSIFDRTLFVLGRAVVVAAPAGLILWVLAFTLEMPPYRPPQLGKVLVRSIFDRTLFVLGRAVVVAAPAGLILWVLANTSLGGVTLLESFSGALDPFARWMGLDGAILMAFILGFPANEIVLPILTMAYLAQGSLMEVGELTAMRNLLTDHGWTWLTALNTMIFSMNHWPCSRRWGN